MRRGYIGGKPTGKYISSSLLFWPTWRETCHREISDVAYFLYARARVFPLCFPPSPSSRLVFISHSASLTIEEGLADVVHITVMAVYHYLLTRARKVQKPLIIVLNLTIMSCKGTNTFLSETQRYKEEVYTVFVLSNRAAFLIISSSIQSGMLRRTAREMLNCSRTSGTWNSRCGIGVIDGGIRKKKCANIKHNPKNEFAVYTLSSFFFLSILTIT